MNICRWGAAVGALNSNLYICGGSDDASRLETVERFDPFANVWVPSTPMSSSRNGVGVTAGNGRIYAIGEYQPFEEIEFPRNGDDNRRFPSCLCLKASPSVKVFIWKLVLFTRTFWFIYV